MRSFALPTIIALALVATARASEHNHIRSHKHSQAAHHQNKKDQHHNQNQNNQQKQVQQAQSPKMMKCSEIQSGAVYQFVLGNGRHGTNTIPWNVESAVQEDGWWAWSTTKDASELQSFSFQECDSDTFNAHNSKEWQYGLLHTTKWPDWCLRASQGSNVPETSIVLKKCDYTDQWSPQARQLWVKRRGPADFIDLLNAPMIVNHDGSLRQPTWTDAYMSEDDLRTNRYDGRQRLIFRRHNTTGNSRVAIQGGLKVEVVPASTYGL